MKGLEDDLCQSPHWGYLIEGEITVNYKDGKDETVSGGDLFYWPAGHTVTAVIFCAATLLIMPNLTAA